MLPPMFIIWGLEVDDELFNAGIELGLTTHFILIFAALTSVFFVLRFIFQKMAGSEADPILNSQSIKIACFFYAFMFLSFLTLVVSTDFTKYGKWIRGIKEIQVVDEFEPKTKREKKHIMEAKEISKDSKAATVVFEMYNERFIKMSECKF